MSEATSTSVPSDAAAAPGVGGFTHRQILTILTGLMLGMFLAALDQNIVATAIRTIGDDLHGLSVQAWVTTAYLITSTVSTPLYGKLSDLYGRKPFFLLAITIFITGSAACAFSTSMYMLAAFRAYQGLGAGGLFSLALAIIGDIVSPRDRAKYQGYFLAVFGTASVLGPVLGGFFAGSSSILTITGWRWVFLVNVPIGIVALYVVWRTLNLPNTHRPAQIDWVGVGALFVCLVPLLVVAEQGQKWGWGSGTALLCYGLGIAGLVLFILAEHRMGDNALIPLRFFQNRVFSLTSIVGVLVGMGLFGGISVLPLYLQIVRGVSPTEAGLLLLPLTAGLMVGAIISGQLISRTGRYKIYPVIGALLCVIALVSDVVHRCRHALVADRHLRRSFRARHRQHHAADHARHAERDAGARHRGCYFLGDLLPPDGRHARRSGVPVGLVQHGRPQHRDAIREGRQDRRFPGCRVVARRHQRPRQQATADDPLRSEAADVQPERHVLPQTRRQAPRAPVLRRILELDGRHLLARSCGDVHRFRLVAAGRRIAAAHDVRHPGTARRRESGA